MRPSLLIACFAFWFACSPSDAADTISCLSEPGRDYAVAAVMDGETLKLDTGDEMRLVGILAPRGPAGEGVPWPPHDAAIDFLRQQTLGRKLDVRAAGRSRDRYRRLLGHAILMDAGGSGGTWLNEALVRAGHARVFGLDDTGACETALLAAEDDARTARRGLWANEVYRVRDAEAVRELMGLSGTFQIIEGRVATVAIRGSRAYLNFGQDWTRDFTVLAVDGVMRGQRSGNAASRAERSAARRAGEAAIQAFEGKRVRVRGWVRIRNGPMIEVQHLEDIERLEP